jgi:hypothetical protein
MIEVAISNCGPITHATVVPSIRNTLEFVDADDVFCVQFHNTVVFRASPLRLAYLNSNGWRTVTTKQRMNSYLRQFGYPLSIYQKNHVWYVSTPTGDIEFEDDICFNDKGERVISAQEAA